MRQAELEVLLFRAVAPLMYEPYNGGIKLTANIDGEDYTAAVPMCRNGHTIYHHVNEAFYYKFRGMIDELIFDKQQGGNRGNQEN